MSRAGRQFDKGFADTDEAVEFIQGVVEEVNEQAAEIRLQQFREFNHTGKGYEPWMWEGFFGWMRHGYNIGWYVCPVCDSIFVEHKIDNHITVFDLEKEGFNLA